MTGSGWVEPELIVTVPPLPQNYPEQFKLPVEGQLASECKVQRNIDFTPI